MKIAVVQKKSIVDSPLKKWLLDGVKASGEFDVVCLASAKELSADFDKVLVFGGDGTMLDAVRHAVKFDIPVLGVNLGNLGFLTEFDKDATSKELVKALLSTSVVKKAMLDIEFDGKTFVALNELVLKSASTRPQSYDLFIDGNFADTFKSDGLIIATPTGSTAYSLSAGGPVLAPDVKAMLVIPICPHSLHSRPLIVSDKAKIEVRVVGDEGEVSLTADGNIVATASKGEQIVVTTSEKTAKFVRVNGKNFFGKLLEKMNGWSITLQKTE
ncbi:MAG: NAD(+)/NADH kinase [Clostridia bacterium]|nr:NAD(+)/NADH kinase [Clostridia bacterium]